MTACPQGLNLVNSLLNASSNRCPVPASGPSSYLKLPYYHANFHTLCVLSLGSWGIANTVVMWGSQSLCLADMKHQLSVYSYVSSFSILNVCSGLCEMGRNCSSEMLILVICSSRRPLAHIVQDMKTNGQLGLTLKLSHLPLENFCWIPGLPRTHTRQKTRCFLVSTITPPGRERAGLSFILSDRSCI